jgi:DNA-binding transcriptional ArsR family regulator
MKVLADQTRLEILDLLKSEIKSSLQIQTALSKSQSTISQHLKVLTNKNIVIFEKINNIKYYKIKYAEIFKILIEIKAFVEKINKDKLQAISNEDVIDTLS